MIFFNWPIDGVFNFDGQGPRLYSVVTALEFGKTNLSVVGIWICCSILMRLNKPERDISVHH